MKSPRLSFWLMPSQVRPVANPVERYDVEQCSVGTNRPAKAFRVQIEQYQAKVNPMLCSQCSSYDGMEVRRKAGIPQHGPSSLSSSQPSLTTNESRVCKAGIPQHGP
jgi:hypothetical protein